MKGDGLTDEERTRALLRGTETSNLLQAFASLTHRIHGLHDDPTTRDLVRSQRNEVKNEILRRTGDL